MQFSSFNQELIKSWGYPGLLAGLFLEFVGIAFPGEATLTFTGFLISQGILNLLPVLLVVYGGGFAGSTLAYYIGRRFGRQALLHYGRYLRVTPERLERVERWFWRYKLALMIIGRYIPGVRALAAYVAGISGLNLLIFWLYSTLGIIIWATTFILLGHILGNRWETALQVFYHYIWLVVALALAAIIGIYLYHRRAAQGNQGR